MKKTLLALGLVAASSSVFGADALVLDVNPQYKNVTQYEKVVTTEFVCNNYRSNDGLIERGTAGVFGSTQGLIGTAIGVAIGDKIGNGSGRDAAKVVGGIVGNRIGNNIARGQSQSCEPVDRVVNQPYTVTVVDHYRVTVEMGGQRHVIYRNNEPTIGEYIPVRVTVK